MSVSPAHLRALDVCLFQLLSSLPFFLLVPNRATTGVHAPAACLCQHDNVGAQRLVQRHDVWGGGAGWHSHTSQQTGGMNEHTQKSVNTMYHTYCKPAWVNMQKYVSWKGQHTKTHTSTWNHIHTHTGVCNEHTRVLTPFHVYRHKHFHHFTVYPKLIHIQQLVCAKSLQSKSPVNYLSCYTAD